MKTMQQPAPIPRGRQLGRRVAPALLRLFGRATKALPFFLRRMHR
jgi:hypothetical protein